MKNQILFLLLIISILYSCSSSPEQKKAPEKAQNKQQSKEELPEMKPENHNAIMDMVLGKPKHNIRTIGILVYDGVNDLDFTGPNYILRQMMGAKTQLIGLKEGRIKTVMGTEITPNTVIDSVKQLDILVIPGGARGTVLAMYDQKLQDWIRMIDKNSIYTTSVCTGGWILAKSGLLKDKKATTNWFEAEKMLAKYGAKFQQERYVNDGKYWTSAGVTAGMDMSLAIVRTIWGDDYTQAIMLDMEYDPAPPIEGGTPKKTGTAVLYLMESMYEMSINPIIDSLENVKKQ